MMAAKPALAPTELTKCVIERAYGIVAMVRGEV